jgi:hypothetical protein
MVKKMRCENCLGKAFVDVTGEKAVCDCGHKTSRRTAELLGQLVSKLGEQAASLRITSLIECAIGAAGLSTTSNGLHENVPINGEMIARAILAVDPGKVFSRDDMERKGVEIAKEIIEERMRILSEKFKDEVGFAEAATVTAYLYDAAERKMAPTIIQPAQDNFFMMEPGPDGKGMKALHIDKGVDEVLIVMGEAEMCPLALTQSVSIMEFKCITKVPLAVIYRAGSAEHSRLILYVG